MNKLTTGLLAAMFAVGVGTSSVAHATFVSTGGGSEPSLQQIINGLHSCSGCAGAANAPDVNTQQYAHDEQWTISGSGGSLSTFIVQVAGLSRSHVFGIYDLSSPGKQVSLFDGNGGLSAGQQVLVGIRDDGSVIKNFSDTAVDFAGNAFGYFLFTGRTTFYSQSHLNPDGLDQMVAYEGDGDKIKIGSWAAGPWGANEFILAWEDITYNSSDKDFNDFVVLVESVQGIPEPGSLALMGVALVGLGALRRRIA